MTLVSAIVPTRDRPAFVAGAVETALSQTHEEMEAVVVCDPPTDETREALAPYDDDARVRTVYNDEPLGLSASRNLALEYARGEFVCILDDDDRWGPEKVEKQLAVARENPDCGVVYTGGVARLDGRVTEVYEPARRGDIYPEILGEFDLKPYSGHMIRASCFDDVGGWDTDFDGGEDWDHTIRLAREYPFEYVDEPLVVRHYHDDNTSNEPLEKAPAEDPTSVADAADIPGRIWSKYRDEIRRYPSIERTFRKRQNIAYGWNELGRDNRVDAIRHGWRAFKHGPSSASLAIVVFACLGPSALEGVRRLRYAVADRQAPRLDASRA